MKEKIFKKGFTRRLLKMALALAMIFSLMPMGSVTVHAALNENAMCTTHASYTHWQYTGSYDSAQSKYSGTYYETGGSVFADSTISNYMFYDQSLPASGDDSWYYYSNTYWYKCDGTHGSNANAPYCNFDNTSHTYHYRIDKIEEGKVYYSYGTDKEMKWTNDVLVSEFQFGTPVVGQWYYKDTTTGKKGVCGPNWSKATSTMTNIVLDNESLTFDNAKKVIDKIDNYTPQKNDLVIYAKSNSNYAIAKYYDGNWSTDASANIGDIKHEISKKKTFYVIGTVQEPHTWSYAANGATLTATCDKACGEETAHTATLTLSASSTNYSGSAATITVGSTEEQSAWTNAGLTVPTAIAYEKANGDALTAAPTAAGSYVAKVSPEGETATADNTAKVSFTIEEKYSFRVGEKDYEWFSQAVNDPNASSLPIVLLKDKKTATEIPANKDVTIDLNGHYMNCTDSNSTIVTQANSTLTIIDTNKEACHYFKYKNNDVWEFVEKPENTDSAIAVGDINANTADDTLIKVAGGVITGNGITNKGTLVVDGVNIVGNNLTNTNGGAIKNMKGEVTINKGMLLGNKALRGGAIVNDAGKLTIGTEDTKNGDILIAYNNAIDTNPNAEAYGGAIYSYNDGKVKDKQAIVTLNSGEIKYNKCERGAGVCGAVDNSTLVSKIIIPSSSTIVISNNVASNGGGGIMLRWGATLEMNAGTITNNSAVKWSGGLDIGDESKATITGGTIANNSSEQKGGGISVRDNGQLTMSGGSVTNNTAGVAGGGVHFAEKDKVECGVEFSDSAVVKDNTSGAKGSKITDNVYIGATKKLAMGTLGTTGYVGVTLGTTGGVGQFIEGTVTDIAQLNNYHSDKNTLGVYLKDEKGVIAAIPHDKNTQIPVAYKTKAKKSTVKVPGTYTEGNTVYTFVSLKRNAFNGKYVKKVVLPATIQKIESRAFAGDNKLRSIKINSTKVTVSKSAFKGIKKRNLSKIKVTVSKKMSKKNFKKLKKNLVKQGLRGSKIVRK